MGTTVDYTDSSQPQMSRSYATIKGQQYTIQLTIPLHNMNL